MLHRLRPTTIALVLIFLTALASAVVITATVTQRADRAEGKAAAAQAETAKTEDRLATTEQTLSSTRSDLDVVTRSLDRATEVSTQLTDRDTACRAVVRVSDELLHTATSYGKVTDHLIAGREGHASDLLGQAIDHLDRIDRLVANAGYTDISALYDGCVPGIDLQLVAEKLGVEAPPVTPEVPEVPEVPAPPVTAREN